MRRPPPQRPGNSDGVFVTPDPFIAAVKHRLWTPDFVVDLAASASNTKAVRFLDEAHDSLAFDWSIYADRGWCWLNPPFTNIEPWAKKCAHERRRAWADDLQLNIALLIPMGAPDYVRDHVAGKAYVLMLNGRLDFTGDGPYPKDCMLALYGLNPGYEVWDWRKEIS